MMNQSQICDRIHHHLLRYAPGLSVPTAHLVALLHSEFPDIPQTKLASIIIKLAEGQMCAYATRGEARAGKGPLAGKMVRPWRWHAPIADRTPPETPKPITLRDVMDKLAAIQTLLNTIVRDNAWEHVAHCTYNKPKE